MILLKNRRIYTEGVVIRRNIEFNSEGVTLRGWLYLPDGVTTAVPTIVMAHGYSAVKEMYLDAFAEVFSRAGLGALVFDNRNFGASGGEPPKKSICGSRYAIIVMPSLMQRACRKSMSIASRFGGRATVVVMY